MKTDVLAFGIAKDIFGAGAISINVNGATVAALKQVLEEQYPELKALASYMVAVNDAYADDDTVISEQDEIAIIPPVSGG